MPVRMIEIDCLIAMMAETSLRLGEILGIHYTEDIDFERRTVRVGIVNPIPTWQEQKCRI